MAIFAILNLLKFVLFIVALVVIGYVLIKAKRKRREQMHDAMHQLFNSTDTNNEENKEI